MSTQTVTQDRALGMPLAFQINWASVPDDGARFTRKDLVVAHVEGHDQGFELGLIMGLEQNMTDKQREIFDKFRSRTIHSFLLSEEVKDTLEEMGIRVADMYLRPDWHGEFETLVIVDADQYYSDSFMKAYEVSSSAGDKASKLGFDLSVLFGPDLDCFREQSAFADGYEFKHLENETA